MGLQFLIYRTGMCQQGCPIARAPSSLLAFVQTQAIDSIKQKAMEELARKKIEKWVSAQAMKAAAERVCCLRLVFTHDCAITFGDLCTIAN